MSMLSQPINIQPKGFPPIPEQWSFRWKMIPASSKGMELYQSSCTKSDHPQKACVVIHGQGEHSGRYLHFPHYLMQSVDAIYYIDLRGHGRSEGTRGHIDSFKEFTDDVSLWIKNSIKAKELHLFAHSMGGLIGLDLLFSHPEISFSSATISAPLLDFKIKFPLVKVLGASLLSRAWANLQMDTGLNLDLLSHDPEVKIAVEKDGLCHSKGTPRLYTELKAAMERVRNLDKKIKTPLMMVVPMEDQIVSPQATLEFYERLKQENKSCVQFENFYHESFNELEKEKAFKELNQWIYKNSKN